MRYFHIFLALSSFFLFKMTCEAKLPFEAFIHEAFISPEQNKVVYQAVPLKPPPLPKEVTPIQNDSQFIWIPGYWAWEIHDGSFVWVPGVWRKPPPGMIWTSGYWKQFEEGWVWFNGFWTKAPYQDAEKQTQFPPSNINEKLPPAPGRDYFWMSGQWIWDKNSKTYLWQQGRFEKFDSQWIYHPGVHYWRENGYYFEGPFWDWPVEDRGIAYVFQGKAKEPIALTTQEILQGLLLKWPDYKNLLQYYVFFFNDVLRESGLYLDWWDSPQWWALNWAQQWALWWWWSHPSYPQPAWIDESIASEIASPSAQWISLMSNQIPPPILTPDGGTTLENLWKGIIQVTGARDGPILPTDPREVEDIQLVARPVLVPPSPYLRPDGLYFNGSSKQLPSPKVSVGISKNQLSTEPLKIPPKPASKVDGLYTISFECDFDENWQDQLLADVIFCPSTSTLVPGQPYQPNFNNEGHDEPEGPMGSVPIESPPFKSSTDPNPHGRKRPLNAFRSPPPLNPDQGDSLPPPTPPLPFMQQDKGNFMNHSMTTYGPNALNPPQENIQPPNIINPPLRNYRLNPPNLPPASNESNPQNSDQY